MCRPLAGLLASGLLLPERKFTGFSGCVEGLTVRDDAQLLADDPDLLEVLQDVVRHAGWQIHETVVVPNVYPANVATVHAGFVGNGAHDVARLHPVHVADGQPVAGRAILSRSGRWSPRTLRALEGGTQFGSRTVAVRPVPVGLVELGAILLVSILPGTILRWSIRFL